MANHKQILFNQDSGADREVNDFYATDPNVVKIFLEHIILGGGY